MLKIVTVPNPILSKKAAPIEKIDGKTRQLASDMINTCRTLKGIGLAAPQIGQSVRMCVIDLEEFGVSPMALLNPKIVKKSWKRIEMEEGCLSVPGVWGMVKRPMTVKVKAMNLGGKTLTIPAEGILARVLQHEIDHLDGILFTSKVLKPSSNSKLEKM